MESADKKNNKAILIGVVLISLVFVVTFFRSDIFKKEPGDNSSPSKKNTDYPRITSQSLKERMKDTEGLQIIDIRTADDYKLEHLIGSLSTASGDSLDSINPGKTVIIVGYPDQPQQYLDSIDYLKKRKVENVFVLEGGINGWKNAGGNTISIGNPGSFVDNSKVVYITPEDFKKIIDEKKYPVFIVDVRDKTDFLAGHIAGAQNIPLDDIEKSTGEFPVGKEIIVYGDTELQGFQGGVRLYDLGFLAFRVLQGGFSGWEKKGFPVEK